MTRNREGLRPLSQTGMIRIPRNAKQRVHGTDLGYMSHGDFRVAVMTTHRDLPGGYRQDDTRDDKYLHSHARAMRGLVAALDRRSAA
jgi:hypothetical protein